MEYNQQDIKMDKTDELSEIIYVSNLKCRTSDCECADPGTGGDECFCEDF